MGIETQQKFDVSLPFWFAIWACYTYNMGLKILCI